jgi:hypothetical protein
MRQLISNDKYDMTMGIEKKNLAQRPIKMINPWHAIHSQGSLPDIMLAWGIEIE